MKRDQNENLRNSKSENESMHTGNTNESMRGNSKEENISNNREHHETDRSSSNSEAEKTKAANAGRSATDQLSDNTSPSRGELRGTPGVSRAASDHAGTAGGLKPKMGTSGSDLDGQLTDV